MIKKTKRGYEVLSHTTGRSFGIYPTKKLATVRLRQIKFFGRKK